MWQYRSSRDFTIFAVALAFVLQAFSCGLVDLRPVTVTVQPHEANAVLASRDACVSVSFSEEPLRLEAERAFSVESAAGAVEGDFSWNGSSFSWKPVKRWDPGLRYRMVVQGSIGTVGGREARPAISLPFYAVRSAGLPSLDGYWPLDGESASVCGAGATALELIFSEPMDRTSVKDAFSLSPNAGFDMVWDDAATTTTIVPVERLAPCSVYHWVLGTGARAVDGAPLAREEKASFVTDRDMTAPWVARTYPVVLISGAWVEAASALGELDAGHSIAVMFSEAVDGPSVVHGLRLESGQSGRVDIVSPFMAVYTPDRAWEPGTTHTLTVSTDVVDLSGNGLVKDYLERFTPVVPFMRVLEVTAANGEVSGDLGGQAMLPVSIGVAPEGLLALTLNFSSSFDPAAKVIASGYIALSAFFPSSLPGPSLRSITWFSDDTVTLEWEGLRRSGPTSENYYRLTVTGGLGGVISGTGLHMESDASIYLVAKE